jgi:starch synthase
MSKPLSVLSVTAEMDGMMKTGGLGEVAAALPLSFDPAVHMRVLMPGYPSVWAHLRHRTCWGTVPARGDLPAGVIWEGQSPQGFPMYLLDCPALFDRPGTPYGPVSGTDHPDNLVRFAALGWAAAFMSQPHGPRRWRPEVLHLHDWSAALAAAYAAHLPHPVPTVLTLHNLAYQGLFEPPWPDLDLQAEAMGDAHFWGKFSCLLLGLKRATRLTTVSPTYADQIVKPEWGCGLDGLLAERAAKGELTGILNGIQAAAPLSWAERADQRRAVQAHFGLAPLQAPLFAVIARLVPQKGVDVVVELGQSLAWAGAQLAIMGEGLPELEARVQHLERQFPAHISAQVTFDSEWAHRLYATSDFLLMPSRFEPCGLAQMQAQTQGCLPIAHATGGLKDTIEDGHTGFLIARPSTGELRGGIMRALEVFHRPLAHQRMRRAAMRVDHRWNKAARAYQQIYQQVQAAG